MSRSKVVAVKSKRKHRPRPTPRWLTREDGLNAIAQRRTLLVLSVLSGEVPVTDAVEKAGISRMTYYQLETRALAAMVEALSPSAPGRPPAVTHEAKIAELEGKVKALEQEKRRAERLLYVTRKLVRPGKLTTGTGRPAKDRSSKPSSASGSTSSGTSMSSSSHPPSTPTPVGGTGP
jgi:hypothetical protein